MKEPVKFTGKFKDDFEGICQSRNLKDVPDVMPRGGLNGARNFTQSLQSEKPDKNAGNKGGIGSNTGRGGGTRAAVDITNAQINENDIDNAQGILFTIV